MALASSLVRLEWMTERDEIGSQEKKKSIREEQKHPQKSEEQSGGHLLPWDFLITGLGERIQDGELEGAEVLAGQGKSERRSF